MMSLSISNGILSSSLRSMSSMSFARFSSCGLRATDSGIVSLRNHFEGNFVGHLALDCDPLTHMDCVYTGSEDCDMLVRNGRAIKLVGNTFDGEMAKSVTFLQSEAPLIAE